MVVKPGYKYTEVGVIPEDWEFKSVQEFAAVKGGKRLPLGRSLTDKPTGHPYIRVTDMRPGGVEPGDIRYVPDEIFPAIRNYRIRIQDLFISVAGTLGIVGKIPPEFDGANLTENADKITDITCDRDYLLYSLSAERIQNSIASVKTIGAQPKLAINQIEAFRIALPPTIAEQRAIATALSDVDALLGGLERLIAKNRDLKQAAMQQLLTARTRLPGFHGEWEVKSLDQITSRAAGVWGKNEPGKHNNRRVEIIRAGDISQDGRLTATAYRYISNAEFNKAKCDLDDLVITTSGNGLGKVWWCDGRGDIAASNFVRVLHPYKRDVSGKFLYYALRTVEGSRRLQEHTATSAYPNLRPTFFSTSWIPVPPLREQIAIAAVVTDMDAELAALEVRRDKTRAVKQAMMQELLTGRTRLVADGSGHV